MRMKENGRRLVSAALAALVAGGLFALFPSGVNAAAGDISLFAGPSTLTTAPFRPAAVSSAGTRVYFADTANNQVDFFDTSAPGTVTVAAGTGSPGAGADGVAGSSSALNTPTAVFVMATTSGTTTQYTVWVADTANNRVRQIAPDGTITTVTGAGLSGPQGVAFAPGVGTGSGTLFVSDTNNNRILQVDSTGAMSTYITGLTSPRGLAIGESNTVYTVDQGIPGGSGGSPGEGLKFKCTVGGAACASGTGVTTVVAGGGFNNNDSTPGGLSAVGPSACPSIANALQLQSPQGLAVDTSVTPPSVLIADAGNDDIHKVTQNANTSCLNMSTDAAGSPGKPGFSGDGGPATPSSSATPLLNFPEGVALTSSGFYIADTGNGRIRQVTGSTLSTVSVSGQGFVGDNGPATQAQLDQPIGVAVDTTSGSSAGAAYIADSLNNRVRKVSAAGTITTFAGTGQPGSSGDLGPAASAQLNDPSGVAVDPSGNVFIADTGSNKVREVRASDGTIVTVAGNGGAGSSGDGGPAAQAQLNQPRGVAADALGNLYIADTLSNAIRRVDLTSQTITTFEKSSLNPQSASNNGNIKHPWAVAVDGKNNVYWTDTEFHQVASAPPAGGGASLVAGDGTSGGGGDGGPAPAAQLSFPKGLAIDTSGTVEIADSGNNKVRAVSANVIKTVAGNGIGGYQGDGGPATSAELNGPTGLALTGAGDLLIGDTLNSRVRKVQSPSSAPPTTTTTTTTPSGGPRTSGYWFVASDGGIFSFGDAKFLGSEGGTVLNKPVVGMAATPSRAGYWMVASDGGIFSFGDAKFFGSTGATPLNKPVVGMSSTPSGNGYWLVASDGGIFSFGDAKFFGSTGATPLNKPIVGMSSTPSGNGYWFVASDGGVFSFGDAKFFGSAGGTVLNKPIVGTSSTPSGNGYWLVASDGGVFSFGDAKFFGSTGATPLNKPVVGMATTGTGNGYWFVASDGGIFTFGDGQFHGSTGATKLNKPVVGMAGFQS